jgi:hypothetical protein
MMDFLQSLFGNPANDPKMPQGQLTADNLPALMAYMRQPTANDRLMAASKALSAIGNARAQGGDFGMALGAGGQAMQDTIGAANQQRMGELQSQMTLRDLFKPQAPKYRTLKTTENGKPYEITYADDEAGGSKEVGRIEIKDPNKADPYLEPRLRLMDAQINNANSRNADNGIGDIQKQIAQMKLDQLEADAKAPPVVKPLSSALQKYQDEELGGMMELNNTVGKLDRSINALGTGDLDPSFMGNLGSVARNKAGYSSPSSRAYSDLNTTLTSMQMAVLASQKGTQTERDAILALQAAIDNSTDKEYLKEHLPQLRKTFANVLNERSKAINMMRRQQGQPELNADELAPYTPAIIGDPPAKTGGLTIGDVQDGHVYLGGDPANPASWRAQ